MYKKAGVFWRTYSIISMSLNHCLIWLSNISIVSEFLWEQWDLKCEILQDFTASFLIYPEPLLNVLFSDLHIQVMVQLFSSAQPH